MPKKGYKQTLTHKENIKLSLQGIKNPNFGKQCPEDIKKRLRELRKKYVVSEKTKKIMRNLWIGDKNPFYGKHHSLDTRIALSKVHTGKKFPFLGEKMKVINKELWSNPEYATRVFNSQQHKPSRRELKLISLFDYYLPKQLQYTGNNYMWIAGHNPDFRIVGQKKLLEYDDTYYHSKIVEHDSERNLAYIKSGWKIFCFSENDIRKPDFIDRVKEFISD